MSLEIMVDIDDVLMPWAETVHQACGDLGLHDFSKPWSGWHMWEDYGCTKQDWLYGVERAVENGLYTTTDPYPYAAEMVNALRWHGHKIHIVTARGFMENGTNIRRWTREWLERYAIGHDSLTFAKDKVQAMDDLGVFFDHAIDDGIHNYTALDEAGVDVWLHTQPHNLAHETDRRVDSVWEFAQKITRRNP